MRKTRYVADLGRQHGVIAAGNDGRATLDSAAVERISLTVTVERGSGYFSIVAGAIVHTPT